MEFGCIQDQEITHPETIDTFYIQWMSQWVEGGEQITTPKSDSVLVEWMNTYISNGETITPLPQIAFFIPEENIWVNKKSTDNERGLNVLRSTKT